VKAEAGSQILVGRSSGRVRMRLPRISSEDSHEWLPSRGLTEGRLSEDALPKQLMQRCPGLG
jgi:hypothetical protein